MKVYRVSIFLADGQWGNEVMDAEAKRYAESFFKISHAFDNPPAPLVMDVYEHGGWMLVYYVKIGANPIIIGSANDGAQWSPAQQNIRDELSRAEVVALPECRNR